MLVHHVPIDEVVANFIRGVGEHQHNLLAALGDTTQADGKAVAAQDGEDHADGLAAQLCADVLSDMIHGCVVTLGTGDNGLGHANDVTVADNDLAGLDRISHTGGNDLRKIIALADDRCAHAHGNSTKHTAHEKHSNQHITELYT